MCYNLCYIFMLLYLMTRSLGGMSMCRNSYMGMTFISVHPEMLYGIQAQAEIAGLNHRRRHRIERDRVLLVLWPSLPSDL